MAVDQPFAEIERLPDHVVALAGTYINRIGLETRFGRQRLAVARHDSERPAMDVHRMDQAVV